MDAFGSGGCLRSPPWHRHSTRCSIPAAAVWNLLEGRSTAEVELIVPIRVNARHMKNVPGRKTDVKDCQWIAQLLSAGLLRPSFVPERPQRELRDQTRQRVQLIEDKTRVANRIQKILEDAKTVPEHHRFMLKTLLEQVEYLESRIEVFDQRIEGVMNPLELEAVRKLDEIPGFDRRTAQNVLAEIGTDMSRFPSSGHLFTWAGMAPGNNESADNRRSGHVTEGNKWLKRTLAQTTWGSTTSSNATPIASRTAW